MNSATPSVIQQRVSESQRGAISRALALGYSMTNVLAALGHAEINKQLRCIPDINAALQRATQSLVLLSAQRDEVVALANRNRILYQSRLKKLREQRDALHNKSVGLHHEMVRLRQENADLRKELEIAKQTWDD